MQVGDLVERPWEHPGRIGLIIERLAKNISRGVLTGDTFVVQWTDGSRDIVRSQFLEAVK
jgi:hypothetical protein